MNNLILNRLRITRTFLKSNHKLVVQLLIALLVFMIPAVIFGLIAEDVHDGDALALDETILRFINDHSNGFLDDFFSVVTNLGGAFAIASTTILITALLIMMRKRFMALLLFASVAGASIVNYVLKILFARDRPDLWQSVVHESSFSFPSGHAMASSALGIALIVVLWTTSWRVIAAVLAVVYITVIGYSRMYLGVHYPTDVIGGWILSSIWVAFVTYSIQLFRHRHHRKSA